MSDGLKYHVTKAGVAGEESLGPWSVVEIAERLASSELTVTDFAYDESKEDWIALVEFEPLKQHLRNAKPKAKPPGKAAAPVVSTPEPARAPQPITLDTSAPSVSAQWFVQKGTVRHGPFTYLSVLRALQDKSLYEFDYVWTEGMSGWKRIAEHEAFAPEKIRELSSQNGGVVQGQAIFTKRAHPRHKIDSEVIVHDDSKAWMARAYEGSVGGSGLIIENAVLHPGQKVRLHFAPMGNVPAFNAVAEIVNKKYVKAVRGLKSPVKYAVRFLEVDESAKGKVAEFFSKSA